MKSIGIDIGKKRCFYCVLNEEGMELEESSYANTVADARAVTGNMTTRYGACQAVCESTGNMWLKTYEEFEKGGIPIKLANPLKTRAIAEARIKTDRLDARILAHLLRTELVAECHVPASDVREQKQILRHRESLVQDRTRAANRIHSLLDRYDLRMPKAGSGITGAANMKWLEGQRLPSEHSDHVMHQSLSQIRQLSRDIRQLEKTVDRMALDNEDARRIMSLTGFNSFGALLIALEIDGIRRFSTPKQLVSWMGMCPTTHQSGDTLHHGRMKKDSNRRVNWMMMQAAQTASFKDERMMAVYERVRKNRPHGIAVSHVANKMATIIWHMLTSKTLYAQRKDTLYKKKLKKIAKQKNTG